MVVVVVGTLARPHPLPSRSPHPLHSGSPHPLRSRSPHLCVCWGGVCGGGGGGGPRSFHPLPSRSPRPLRSRSPHLCVVVKGVVVWGYGVPEGGVGDTWTPGEMALSSSLKGLHQPTKGGGDWLATLWLDRPFPRYHL